MATGWKKLTEEEKQTLKSLLEGGRIDATRIKTVTFTPNLDYSVIMMWGEDDLLLETLVLKEKDV